MKFLQCFQSQPVAPHMQYISTEVAMSFSLYLLGFAIVIAGLAYGAYLMHIPQHWIAVGVVVLAGLGILSGVASTRHRDPSS